VLPVIVADCVRCGGAARSVLPNCPGYRGKGLDHQKIAGEPSLGKIGSTVMRVPLTEMQSAFHDFLSPLRVVLYQSKDLNNLIGHSCIAAI
jgi:hypothetical protein